MPSTTEADAAANAATSGSSSSTAKLSQTLSKLRFGGAKPKNSNVGEGGSTPTTPTPAEQKKASKKQKQMAQQPQQQLQQEPVPQGPDDITLPQSFTVKYLGKTDARGLWGIKHTRKPVDQMVASARHRNEDNPLPFLHLHVTQKGVKCVNAPGNLNRNFDGGPFPIETVSYGVQDIVYQRVFAMIVVKGGGGGGDDGDEAAQPASEFRNPFECYGFVCDSTANARRLTYALAKAFQDFSQTVNGRQKRKPKHFAIDLRTPQQIEEDLRREADSEV